MEPAVTVAIVEDHPVVIEGVTAWLTADPRHPVQVTQVARDVAGLDPAVRADVVILDLELGGRMVTAEIPGLAAAGQRVVVFSAHADPAVILAVLDAGACAYVTKDEGRSHLLDAVLAAAQDRPHFTRSQAKAILADRRAGRPALSAQERQALLLWFQGMSKASVARRMWITENTVRQYINRARMKYATAGRTAPTKDALLARAIEDGIIQPNEVALYTSYAAGQPPDRAAE
jgi:two-component system nitrate/nitrite response regulator NarL